MFANANQNPFMMGEQENFIDIDNNSGNIDIDLNQDQNFMTAGGAGAPIIEPMRERVVNRTIEHVVPHVCPLMYNIKKNCRDFSTRKTEVLSFLCKII